MEKAIDPRHLLKEIAKILKRLSIPYIVTGGMAVLVWGRPRFTADIDIIVELKSDDIDGLATSLKTLSEAGYVDKETMQEALATNGEFNFIEAKTGVKVDFWILKKEPFDLSRLRRQRAKNILGEKVYFISPEDLVLSKLKWYQISQSSRHLEDAESVLKISGKMIDVKYLKKWAKKLGGLETLLNKLMRKARG